MAGLSMLGANYGSSSDSENDDYETKSSLKEVSSTTGQTSVDAGEIGNHGNTGCHGDASHRGYFDVDDDDDVSTSSTESSESYSSDESDGITSSSQPSNQTLPLPSLSDVHRGTTRPTPGSVFAIPYKEAENAHMKILEHHVPLDHSEEKVKEGRYARKRKGRQREGEGVGLFDEKDSSVRRDKRSKVKAGLPQGLLPSKKYMKLHQMCQAKERPWTLKRK